MESSRRTEPSPQRDMMVFGVILFLFFASYASLFGVTIWELTKKESDENLLFLGNEETQLRISQSWLTLYDFYTKNVNPGPKNYSGEYRVVMENSSGVDFRVLDEHGNVIGTTVNRGSKYVQSTIPFTTRTETSRLTLQYKSVSSQTVTRIEISLI